MTATLLHFPALCTLYRKPHRGTFKLLLNMEAVKYKRLKQVTKQKALKIQVQHLVKMINKGGIFL